MFGRGELGFIRSLEPRSVVTVLENQEEIDLDAEHLPEFEFVRNDISDERALVENLLQRGPYDVILFMDTVGFLKDIQGFLESLHPLCTDDTRVVSMYYSYAWGPAFWIAEKIGLKTSIAFNEEGSSGSITLYYSDLDQLDDIMHRLKK